jgi:hypothetical protein
MPKSTAITSWVRWLAHCGVPPDHIARVLDRPPGDVAEALKPQVYGRTKWIVAPELAEEIRRLRRQGWTLRAIGAEVGLPHYVVDTHLHDVWRPAPPRPPRPLDAARPRVGGQTATRFFRFLRMGYEPSRVAELLQVNPAAVDDLVERLKRRQGPGELRRARSHGEQAALSEWDRFIGPEPLPAIARECHDSDRCHGTAGIVMTPTPCEGWGHAQAAEHHPRKLDDDAVRRFWQLRPKLSRRELAAHFGVSMATVGRLIKAGAPPVEVLDEPLPATSAESGPQPHRWREPRGKRGDAWRDD